LIPSPAFVHISVRKSALAQEEKEEEDEDKGYEKE
jgi:hypothetical protein